MYTQPNKRKSLKKSPIQSINMFIVKIKWCHTMLKTEIAHKLLSEIRIRIGDIQFYDKNKSVSFIHKIVYIHQKNITFGNITLNN